MAISDYSATAASNTTIGGIDVSGTTGKVKDGDNVMRQIAADLKAGVITGYTTTATAAGTTTLTVASNSYQYFTGTTTQTVVMPVTSTLELGRTWVIVNESTGALTVNSSGSNLIVTVGPGEVVTVQCILLTGTSAASWNVISDIASGSLQLYSNDAGATAAPVLTFYRDSATPAASDILGKLLFNGEDSAGNTQEYASIETVIVDATSTSEDGQLDFYVTKAGTRTKFLSMTASAVAHTSGASYSFDAVLTPAASDGAALGTSSLMWSDLFLASGGVINFDNSDVVISHSADTVTLTGASNVVGGFVIDTGSLAAATGLRITNSEAGAASAGNIILYRNSATPAANDSMSALQWRGNSSTGVERVYGSINVTAPTVTNTTEEGNIGFNVIKAGTNTNVLNLTSSTLSPGASDGVALGTASLMWSDLFLASGGAIDFNSADVRIVHGANSLSFSGATGGYNYDSDVYPATDDTGRLGKSGQAWGDLFLASGAVINFNAGDVTETHSANALAWAGASSGYSFDAPVTGTQFKLTSTIFWSQGAGSPEGAVTANIGALYSRSDGGATTTLYVKTSGTGNTGWTAK
jgi:hypothetical protein